MELGGKSANIVLNDADLSIATLTELICSTRNAIRFRLWMNDMGKKIVNYYANENEHVAHIYSGVQMAFWADNKYN